MNKSDVIFFNPKMVAGDIPMKSFLAMASFADERGIVWAKAQEMADFMNISLRTLMKDIATMQELDVVRRYKDMVYIMNPDVVRSDADSDTMKPITTSGKEMWKDAR